MGVTATAPQPVASLSGRQPGSTGEVLEGLAPGQNSPLPCPSGEWRHDSPPAPGGDPTGVRGETGNGPPADAGYKYLGTPAKSGRGRGAF